MIEIIGLIVWTLFVAYATWYVTKAKNYAPITHIEARMLWMIHKNAHQCNGKRWREIKRRSKTIGFECECGYSHVQLRPIVGRIPNPTVETQQVQTMVVTRHHAPYNSA